MFDHLPFEDRIILLYVFSQFSRSALFHSLWPHGLQPGQASLSITNSPSLLKLMFIHSVMPPNHLILCCPLLSRLWSFPASGSFSRVSSLHQVAQVLDTLGYWTKYGIFWDKVLDIGFGILLYPKGSIWHKNRNASSCFLKEPRFTAEAPETQRC